jgi:lipopolysaccharide/colanic/teichoic acid biosynthesis glycosyltransferase
MKNGSGVEADRIGQWSGTAPTAGFKKIQKSGWKRAMDLAIAWPLVVFVGPIMMIVWCLLKIFDPGPALFMQLRVGKDGKTFTIFKFRTMRVDAQQRLQALLDSDPAAAAEWQKFEKLQKDPRVTLLGRFLRKSSIDELPQLLNIIRGEMSVVGPRPVQTSEVQRYGTDYPFYTAARPGVVGLWQVSGRNKLTYAQRVAYDIQYVQTWTLLADVMILLRAIPVVMFGRGAF